MKSNRFMDVKQQKLIEEPVPACGVHDILCKTIYCGICGSDIAGYFHGSDFFWKNCEWGHEPVCEVVEVGDEVRDIEVGDRIFPSIITGGFR